MSDLPTPDYARNMRILAHCDQGGRPDGVQIMVHRGFAYIGHMFSKGFSVIDVRDPKQPRAVNYLPAPPGTWNIHLQSHDDLLLVINAKDMFAAAEFADEKAYYKGQLGKAVGTADRPSAGRDWTAGLTVYEISTPQTPRRIAFMPVDGGGIHRIWYTGGFRAYVSALLDGFTDYQRMMPGNRHPVAAWPRRRAEMNNPTKVTVAPKGMGLNDFVAQQEGFFSAEGLDVSLDWKTFRGTQSSWKELAYFERPQDQPYSEGRDVIQGACAWGSICNASAGMGRFVPQAYGDSPWAIFVRPDSQIRTPQDLRDVPIAVGMRAGSHFNVPYRLEKYLPLANIKVVNTGGFGARLKALLEGEVEAASLLPPQIAMAEQLGLRRIIEDRFHTLWWVPESAAPETVGAYLRALDRAEKALDTDLEKYLPLWDLAVPPEFKDRNWDYSKFGRGERFVYKPIPRGEFDDVMNQVERWGLDQHLKERSFERLAADAR